MNAQKMLEVVIANLPVLLSVLGALGLWKLGAVLIRGGVAKAKAFAKGTPNTFDDVVVEVVGGQLEEVARLLQRGDIDAATAKFAAVRASAKPVLAARR